MYYALIRLGEREAAAQHQSKGFGQKNFFINPYRGTAQPIPVVLFVASTGGNAPLEKLIDERVFQTYVVVADFYDARIPLPPHQLVINGIGDVEVSRAALLAAESLLGRTSAPLLNPPSAILATGRSENAARLCELPGLIAPRTSLFPYATLAAPGAAAALLQQGFSFPLLLRVPGFHMGKHFVQVESPAALASAVAELPGAGRPDAQLLAIEYLDARGADGCHRKFRVMMVDGQLFPLHLAISDHWKIHYFSADMADRPECRAEEERFLADMAGFLGPKAMDALRRLQIELGLDYAGIDFGLNAQGEILLFEANATMIVQQPDPGEHWDYRRPAVERIHAAVHRMFLKTASVPATATISD
jgi:glutathione synthase/RimK-type ligase-like ATP-grasp enzyme